MEIWSSVNEADIGAIHEGQVVRFTVSSLPRETFEGKVSQVRLNASMNQNVVTYTVEDRDRFPVRVRYARAYREDEDAVKRLLVPARMTAEPKPGANVTGDAMLRSEPHAGVPEHSAKGKRLIPLTAVADVQITEGPAVIKGENGRLLNYVTLNVRGRDAVGFVAEAKRVVAQKVKLPEGVHIVPAYDRTRLIEGAISTLTTVMWHEMLIAAVAILLILMHVRSVLVICVTLPLAVLFSFLLMSILRTLGIIDIQANIMSLAGITISIGILVDQAIVMTENATHHLKEHFGDRKVTGDIRELVIGPCRTVGRPFFFSVALPEGVYRVTVAFGSESSPSMALRKLVAAASSFFWCDCAAPRLL